MTIYSFPLASNRSSTIEMKAGSTILGVMTVPQPDGFDDQIELHVSSDEKSTVIVHRTFTIFRVGEVTSGTYWKSFRLNGQMVHLYEV